MASIASAQVTTTQYGSGGFSGFGGNVSYRESAASRASFKMIKGSNENMVGLRTDGTLVAWGYNQAGNTVLMPTGILDVVDIEVGWYHVVARRSDGTLFAWGNSTFSSQTTIPAGLGSVIDYSAGDRHTVAVKTNGTVVAWGLNGSGQCNVPAGLSGVTKVAAGTTHSLALKSDGTVVAWGATSDGQSTIPAGLSDVIDVAAGDRFSVALKSDGTVVCWGLNASGQATVPAGLTGVTQIAAGRWNTVALKSDGTVVVWGQNDYGQRTVPANLTDVVQVASSAYWTHALKSDGTLVTWGHSVSVANKPPSFTTGIISVVGTTASVIGLKPDGTLAYWGASSPSSFITSATNVAKVSAGDGSIVLLKTTGAVTSSTSVSNVPAGTFAVDIAAGTAHGLAVKADGTVVAWGLNTSGQATVPAGLTDVVQVAAGRLHSLALKSDGTVVAWGGNVDGQATVPAGLTGVVKVAAGYDNSIALKSDGSVVVWGTNNSSQLNVPASAINLVDVSAGQMYFVGLKADGTVVKWGNGIGGASNTLGGITNVVGMSASMNGTLTMQKVYVDFSVASFYDFQSATGTITLPTPAGPGGVDVTVATSDANVAAPGTVHVPEGSYTATFDLSSSGVDADKTVYVSATYGGYSSWAAITVYKSPNHVSSITLSSNPVTGGFDNPVATVHLLGNATQNITVALTNSDPSRITIPSSVVIPTGYDSVSFVVTTSRVASAGTATITASYSGSAAAQLAVHPIQIAAFSIQPSPILGSLIATGQITLWQAPGVNSDITVVSSNPSVAWVSNPVTIPAGQTTVTFPVNTTLIGTDTNVTFTLSGIDTTPVQITVKKAAATGTITMNPGSVVGGLVATGRISIEQVLTQNAILFLHSSDTAKATVPASVIIPAGSTYIDFPVTTFATLTNTTVDITSDSVSGTLTLTPPTLASVSLPAAMYGVQQVTGTVTLSNPAKGGYTVALASGSANLSIPSSVMFADGATTATFLATAGNVTKQAAIQVTATGLGGPKVGTITVKPNAVKSITVTPAQVVGGSSTVVTGKVTLTAPPYTDVAVLVSKTTNISSVGVPASVMVGPSGTGTFPITHLIVGDWVSTVVTATNGGVAKGAGLVLSPNVLSSITVKPKTIVGGSNRSVVGSVTLTYAVAQDTQIDLVSSDPAAASVPANVTILAGQRGATFTVTHHEVAGQTDVTIGATKSGLTLFAPLSVTPNTITAHTITPGTTVGGPGAEVSGVVMLKAPVAVDTIIQLSATYPAVASVPATITIPAGEMARAYPITTSVISGAREVRITATKIGSSKKASLRVTPP